MSVTYGKEAHVGFGAGGGTGAGHGLDAVLAVVYLIFNEGTAAVTSWPRRRSG
jgi:hypothetical protein